MKEGMSRAPITIDRRDCPQKVVEEREEPEDAAPKETHDVAHIPADEEPPAITESIRTTYLCGIGTRTNLNCNGGGREKSFPCQLYRILANPDYANIITWMPHGRAWKVLRPSEFTRLVAPHYYSHAKFTSFLRQVNGWGFRRITQGFDEGSYYHEIFLRGMPHLLNGINRVKIAVGRIREKEPDFYSMPWMPLVSGGPTRQAQAQRLASISGESTGNAVGDEDEEETPSPSPPNDPPSQKKRPREQASFNDGDRRCDAASLTASPAGCTILVSPGGPGDRMAGKTMPPPSSAAPPVTFHQGREKREYAGDNYGSWSQGCGSYYRGYSGAQQGQENCLAPYPSLATATPASSAAPVCCLNYSSLTGSPQQWGGQQWMPMSRVQPQPHYPQKRLPQVSPTDGQPTQAQPCHPQRVAFPSPPPLAGPSVDQTSSFVQRCAQPSTQRTQQEMQREVKQRMEREAQQMTPQVEEEDSTSYDPREGCDNRQQQKQQGQGQAKKQQDAQSVECPQVMERMQHRMISNANRIVKSFSLAFSNALSRKLENFQGKLMEMLAQQQKEAMLQQQQQGQAQAPLCQGQGQGPPQVSFPQQGQKVPQQQQQDPTRAPNAVVAAGHRPPSAPAMLPPSRQMMMPTPIMPLADATAKAEGIMDDPSAWHNIFDSNSDRLEGDEDQILVEKKDDSSASPEVRQPFPKKRKVDFWFSDDDPVAFSEQGPIEPW